MINRDKNGYLIAHVGKRKFYVTPYNEFFCVRNTCGAIERNEDKQQLIFISESDCISYISNNIKG